jgi:hypothetical protein
MWAVSYIATGCCDKGEQYFVSTETEANDLKNRLEEFFEEDSYIVYRVRLTTPDDVINEHIAAREEMTRRDAAYARVKAEWIASDAYANRKRVILEPFSWEVELAEKLGETLKVEYDEWADREAESEAYTEWCVANGYAKRESENGWTHIEFIY